MHFYENIMGIMQIVLVIIVILLILGVISLQSFIVFFINNFILPDDLILLSIPVVGVFLFVMYVFS